MQTRAQSLVESIVNILIGYWVAVISQIIVFPYFGVIVSLKDDMLIGLWFTIISLIRSYSLRRFYNWYHYKGRM